MPTSLSLQRREMPLHLISHPLCPYVQRAVIALTEKGVEFRRTTIDLANKPDWFIALSPLGKTPVLVADEVPIFESSVILEFLEDVQPYPLHPADPLERARHRAWIEFGSAILNDIAGLYSAKDASGFAAKAASLKEKFERTDAELADGPWFDPRGFSLVDTAFGPVFRYFDVFDEIGDFGCFAGLRKVQAWRRALAGRPSVRMAVDLDYPARLKRFLRNRRSYLSSLITAGEEPHQIA